MTNRNFLKIFVLIKLYLDDEEAKILSTQLNYLFRSKERKSIGLGILIGWATLGILLSWVS